MITGGAGVIYYMGIVAIFVEWMRFDPVYVAAVMTKFYGIHIYSVYPAWFYNYLRGHTESIPQFIIVGIIALIHYTRTTHISVYVIGWRYIFGLLSSIIIVPPTNFLLNYYWTFRKNIP
jgi:hypothetical protein